jgi:hypothetical protein
MGSSIHLINDCDSYHQRHKTDVHHKHYQCWVDVDEIAGQHFHGIDRFACTWLGGGPTSSLICYNGDQQRLDLQYERNNFCVSISFEPGAPIRSPSDPWQVSKPD